MVDYFRDSFGYGSRLDHLQKTFTGYYTRFMASATNPLSKSTHIDFTGLCRFINEKSNT